MNCRYCKKNISVEDVFCPSCDSVLHTPKDFLNMRAFSPLDSMLNWIDDYRSGRYSMGQFQARVSWLMEAVKLQKDQLERTDFPRRIAPSGEKIKESFLNIHDLMIDALQKADQHLRDGQDDLLKKSLVTIHDVHNKLHELKDIMVETFSKEELK